MKSNEGIPDLPNAGAGKLIRLAAGLTATELAARIGVSATTVYSWENARAAPVGLQRSAYAKALGELRSEIAGETPNVVDA